jgi:copper homeostasis protein
MCGATVTVGSGIRTVDDTIVRTPCGTIATDISTAVISRGEIAIRAGLSKESGFFISVTADRISAMPVIEICVDSPEGALAAEQGGADRVELCDNLFEGGTTPSRGAILVARRLIDIKLHVIIRPRGGDFLYSDAELEAMKYDIETARTAGADGIVIGILTKDGEIDVERTAELVTLARPMSVTFHRAFDVCRDPFEALEKLIAIGVDRVLTSGQMADALSGSTLIKQLIDLANGRIAILACGSIDETNAADVVAATGASEFHFTAFEDQESAMKYRNECVAMGSADASSEYLRRITTAEKVSRLIEALGQRNN